MPGAVQRGMVMPDTDLLRRDLMVPAGGTCAVLAGASSLASAGLPKRTLAAVIADERA